MTKERYGSLDGLKSLAAFGIVLMHMRANNNYDISGFVYDNVIASFTNFVYLFMVISAFGLCCGYYERFQNNKMDYAIFYRRRFNKIFPFFALLVIIDIIFCHSISALYEGFGDLTMMFGFLPYPNKISVIGVGWFIGLVFVFYLIFPFYCVLIKSKKSAWISFTLSIGLNIACTQYFDVGRYNILYSGCFFIAGGLVFLYRDTIKRLKAYLVIPAQLLLICLYFLVGGNTFTWIMISSSLLITAIAVEPKFLDNKVFKFVSGLSMEIYLSHMFIFRVLEKLKLNQIIGMGWTQYFLICFLVIAGTVLFAFTITKGFKILKDKKLILSNDD